MADRLGEVSSEIESRFGEKAQQVVVGARRPLARAAWARLAL
ncbi:hypothetical protein [Falsiroseomonas oryziterrae]|nr:hypothetical protein [Roseomonas sp. NPKOSM-4]